ncbi:hypothetical protein M3C92_09245 [Dermabacter hominis]|uniref:hypothetical protein n=1 Tax=Dermabacter hominis TaxID=36740 RepID=UPI0021A88229|nr:hypothetical protein [Dermabacter hominis]MCT1956400.1 hypothetical protein [Dermabacter hominis]
MESNYRRAERALLEEMADVILGLYDQSFPYDLEYKWDEYVTALASHRLANAWERRVEIAEATARQKGINP